MKKRNYYYIYFGLFFASCAWGVSRNIGFSLLVGSLFFTLFRLTKAFD